MNTRPRQFLPGLAGASQPLKALTPVPLNAQPGNGPLAGLTDFFSLNLVNFDWVTWHDYEWENWVAVDALLNAAIGFLNIRGIWKPNTAYSAGQTVFDPADTTQLYTAHTDHTSSTDFNTDKPLYWDLKQAATPPVESVFGRIGAVVATAGDYDAFYYTKAQVDASQGLQDTAITQNATDITALNTNLSTNYYTKTQIDTDQTLQDNAIAANVQAIIDNANDIQTNANAISALSTNLGGNYYTKTEIDASQGTQDTAITGNANAINALTTDLANNYYTKTESDAKFFHYTGPWAAGTYNPAQIVTHNDATWLALVQTTDEPLVTSTDWLALGSSGAKSTIGDTFPTTPPPQSGDMHFKTSATIGLYIYYDDGDSKQWVQTNGGGISKQADVYHDPTGAASWKIDYETNTLECWGSASGNGASVVFPKTFARNPSVYLTSDTGSTALAANDVRVENSLNVSATGVTIQKRRIQGTSAPEVIGGSTFWRAIGEWDGVS